MVVRVLCFTAFVVVSMAALAQPASRDGNIPKNETVMSPGMEIRATTSVGEMRVTAVDELTRSYMWEGARRSVKMSPRVERWYGSLGLFHPGAGEHWKEHKGITRAVTEEGQQHFKSVDEAVEWIRSRAWMPYVYRDDGLVVGWEKTLPRKQLNVDVWQILVNGKKPTHLPGSQNEKIIVTHVELWTSPLGKAVAKQDARAIEELLAGGADPNATNIVGRPVLVEAAKCGYHEIIRGLLQKGANPNVRDELGYTALHTAIVAGHIETVKALVAGGADVNAAIAGHWAITPLMLAAATDAEIVKILLEKGADVNARTEERGDTALFFARMRNREDIVRLLKDAGAKD
jgi:hypothetical protein